MQKKLIALAVAAAAAAPAFAQSNVTVYGQMNVAYNNFSSSPTAGKPSYTGLDNADSRIGFKGEEALGNGLKAVFTQEFGVTADGGAGAGATAGAASGLAGAARQSFVGLSGGFGTVTLGRQYTPYYEAAAALDPFGASGSNVASVATLHPTSAIVRANSAAKYVGAFPMAGGTFIVAGLYGFGEQTTAGAADPRIFNWKFAYAGGPVLAGITGIKLKDNTAGTANTVGDDTKGLAFGGTYDFKVAKLHYIYDKVKTDRGGAGTIVDFRVQTLGVSVPMGVHSIKLAYNVLNDRLATNMDGKHTGIGYAYAMSKRTTLFANYGHVSSDNGANYVLLPGAAAPNAGVALAGGISVAGAGYRTGYQLGMAHSF